MSTSWSELWPTRSPGCVTRTTRKSSTWSRANATARHAVPRVWKSWSRRWTWRCRCSKGPVCMMPSTNGSPTSAPDVSAPPLRDEYAAVCPQCTTKVQWKGAITDEMIARTFTRGLDDVSGLPNCPRCGTPMVAPAPDAVPVREAIATAVEAVGVRDPVTGEHFTRQLSIPGLRPPFDYAAAFESIMERRRGVRLADALAEKKHKEAAAAKKEAEAQQEALSELEDEFDARVQEFAATPADRRRKTCAFERATGTPCPICGAPDAIITAEENSATDHLGAVVRHLARENELQPTDLLLVLERAA